MSFEPVTLELHYEERDLLRVVPFIKRKISGVTWYVLPIIAFFSVAFGALLTIYRLSVMNVAKETVFHVVSLPISLIVLGLFYTVIVIRRVPIMVRKMITTNPLLREPFTLTISEEGIQNNTNGAESKYQWSFVKSCYEKLGGIIVVFQPNTFHFIPAHKISEEKYVAVRKMFAERVGFSEG